MSLIVALKAQDRVVIASDSLHLSGSTIIPGRSKIAPFEQFLIGSVGSLSESDEFFRYLGEHPGDIISPAYQRGRHLALLTAYREQSEAGSRDYDKPSTNYLIACQRRIHIVNQDARVWEEDDYGVIGPGDQVAYYLLLKDYRSDLPLADAQELACFVIREVALVENVVRPPIHVFTTSPS